MDFQELSTAFDKVTKGLNAEVDRIFEVMEKDFVEANQRGLLKGQKSDGTDLIPIRKAKYDEYKQAKGSKAAFLKPPLPDFKDTGSFYRKMVAVQTEKSIEITSLDNKLQKLLDRDGWDIFGVQKKELPTLQDEYSKHLKKYIDAIVL